VRRILAVLLIALFGLLAVSPALSADPESNLPACCRRAGKHHCAMAAESGASSGPAFQSGGRCPYFPGSLVTTSSPVAIAGVFSLSIFAPPAGYSAMRCATAAGATFSPSRSHQKRGPPSFLSFV
jgi:hypothetical protein